MAQDRAFQTIPPLAVPMLAALVMYGVVLFAPQVLYDGDTFWHIAAGELMLDTRAVIHTDPFSHTMPGKEWQTHEWFSEILMALAYRAGGWNGIVILGGLAAGATALIMGVWLARYMPPLSTVMALTLGLGALTPSLLVRPHLIALPLMAAWVVVLLMAREKDSAPPLWLAAMMVLWANLHGSYVFGLVLVGPMALEALIGAPPERRLEVVRRWGLFGVLSLLAALVTPHGVEGLIFPFKVMTMTSLPEIIEWQPTDFAKNRLVEYAIVGALFATLTRGVRVPVLRVLVLLGLFHLMLQHARHALVMGVISPLLLAKPLGEALEPNYRPQMQRLWKPLLAIGLVAVLGVTAVRAVNPLVRRNGHNAPIAALEAVPADLRARPVYNNYGLGGYLIFKGVKVFIDGRADMYGDAYLKDYLKIGRGDSAALDKAIAQYGIEWMMLAPNSGIARRMATKPGWKKLYGDNIAVVYVRSTSLPPSTTR